MQRINEDKLQVFNSAWFKHKLVEFFVLRGLFDKEEQKQNKKTTAKWNQTLLKREISEESEETPLALWCLKCLSLIAGL